MLFIASPGMKRQCRGVPPIRTVTAGSALVGFNRAAVVENVESSSTLFSGSISADTALTGRVKLKRFQRLPSFHSTVVLVSSAKVTRTLRGMAAPVRCTVTSVSHGYGPPCLASSCAFFHFSRASLICFLTSSWVTVTRLPSLMKVPGRGTCSLVSTRTTFASTASVP